MEISFDKDQIIDSVKDLYTGENKYVVWGVSGVLIIALFALVIVSALPKKDKNAAPPAAFAADEELLIPDGPSVNAGSVTSRDREHIWGEEEEKRFLTVPGTAELDDLSEANDRMINDILNAAP